MTNLCPLDWARSIFWVQMTSNMTTSMQNRISNNFSSKSFAQKCVPLLENSKNWEDISQSYSRTKVKCSISVFWIFRQRKAFLGKTLEKSCLEHSSASNWSHGHILRPFKKYTHRFESVRGYHRFLEVNTGWMSPVWSRCAKMFFFLISNQVWVK